MNLKKLKDHLNRYLPAYVIGAMILGLGIGYMYAPAIKSHASTFKTLTTVAVFLIIYPMMVNLKLEALKAAAKNFKALLLALGFNFVYAPLLMFALTKLLVGSDQLGFGLLLATVVPCSSMSIAYTGLSDGNVELSTLVVAASFITALFAIPLWLGVFAGQYHVPSPVGQLVQTILIVLVGPMILGYLTRKFLTKKMGERKFMRLAPLFPSVSMIALYGIVFLIMLMKARVLITKWDLVLWLTIPITIYFALTLFLITWINKRIKTSYADHMAIVYASTGKNEGTAIAIATAAFNPLIAIPAALIPVFQLTFLIGYLKMAGWLRRYFLRGLPQPAPASNPGKKEERDV